MPLRTDIGMGYVAYSSAIASIYQAATDTDHWPIALQNIADCTADHGAILIIVHSDGRAAIVASSSLASMADEYARYWSGRDIRAIRAKERGYFNTRQVITDRDVVSTEEMDSDPHYTYLAGHGLKYFAAVAVSPEVNVNVALSIQRSLDRYIFDQDELEIVGQLARHVEQSLRLSLRLMDSDRLNLGLSEALAQASIGILMLDGSGRVITANQVAETLLGDGLHSTNGNLRTDFAADGRALHEAIERLMASMPRPVPWEPEVVIIRRHHALCPLIARLLPAPDGQSPLAFLGAVKAMILLTDPDRDDPVDVEFVREALNLTPGQAKVAVLIGTGLNIKCTADRLRLSQHTVRSVLKDVFQRAGVNRQAELVSLIAKISRK